jgi:NADH-quinone oxidoreductase subunit A
LVMPLRALLEASTYTTLLSCRVVSAVLSLVILALSILLSTYAPDPEKSSAYECGFEPFEDAREQFDVRFYIVAILFLLFDLEIAVLFP